MSNPAFGFSDVEFVALWEQSHTDFLPAPLVYTGRFPDPDAHRRAKQESLRAVRERFDLPFDGLLDTLAHPDIRVAVWGCGGDDRSWIRLLAVRRGGLGFVVTQRPGETVWHSGGFDVTACSATMLAEAVVAAVPDRKPGTQPDVELAAVDDDAAPDDDAMDYSYGKSEVDFNYLDSSPERRCADFMHAPVLCSGVIDIEQGTSVFGPQARICRRLGWRDLVDDGRYLIDARHPPVATAADAARMTALINSHLAAIVQALKDERA